MQFEQKAHEVVAALPWVEKVNVTMSAQPARPLFGSQLPAGLQTISNIVAVSSCKVVPLYVQANASLLRISLSFTTVSFGK